MDLNSDGRVGGGPGQNPQYNQHTSGGSGGGMMNQLEKATHMDLNGDGRVGGGGVGHPQNSNQFGAFH